MLTQAQHSLRGLQFWAVLASAEMGGCGNEVDEDRTSMSIPEHIVDDRVRTVDDVVMGPSSIVHGLQHLVNGAAEYVISVSFGRECEESFRHQGCCQG